MTKQSERLVAFGFLKKGAKAVLKLGGKNIALKGKGDDMLTHIKELKEEFGEETVNNSLEEIADHEELEVVNNQFLLTDYPTSLLTYQAHIQSYQKSIEQYYYWCLDFLGVLGFPIIDKITDIFTAAEQSSFYGAGAQRLGLTQDKVGQYMATIGKMVKDMFAIIRELRWIDERLEIYREAFGHNKEGKEDFKPKEAAEVTLKGMWVDLVDGVVGGQRTGSNLFTMAQQLQFTALPDLFFSVHPRTVKEVDEIVDKEAADFNKQVRLALKRKLEQFVAWKHSTYDEIRNRRKFTISYLRQHYQSIRMYITWVKPYIKRIERLSSADDLLHNPRLIGAFESSIVEIEVLAKQKDKKKKNQWGVILLNFEYHTQPGMQYSQEGGYHRGPIHIGNTRIIWRSYTWSTEQIENYKKMRIREDLELLKSIDSSLKSAMDTLGEDFFKYIEEAEKGKKEEKKEKPKYPSVFEPFTALGEGFSELIKSVIPETAKGKPAGKEEPMGAGGIKRRLYLHYSVFKKIHGMLTW